MTPTAAPMERCESCGIEFEPLRHPQRFCSPKCIKRAWRARLRGERHARFILTRRCDWCGGSLPPGRADKKWCSPYCTRAAWRAQHKEQLRAAHKKYQEEHPKPKKSRTPTTKACEHCGAAFETMAAHARHCPACRNRYDPKRREYMREWMFQRGIANLPPAGKECRKALRDLGRWCKEHGYRGWRGMFKEFGFQG